MTTVQQLIDEAKELIQEGKDILIKAGRTYTMSEWLTVSRYAQKYNLESAAIITRWILKGIIPTEDILRIDELNGLTLIKDKVYKE